MESSSHRPCGVKVLITGGGGYVGRFVVPALEADGHEVFPVSRSSFPLTLDVCDRGSCARVLGQVKPDVIIHAAAQSSPPKCEEDPAAARCANVPLDFVQAAKSFNPAVKFIFLSTDQVLDGKGHCVDEAVEACPINVYGQTKLDMESLVRESFPNHAILRLSFIYGPQVQGAHTTFLQFAVEKLKVGAEIGVFTDQIRSCICIDDVVETLRLAVQGKVSGIVNLGGPEALSRYDFCKIVADHLGMSADILKADTYVSSTPSPSDISMNISLLASILGRPPRTLAVSLVASSADFLPSDSSKLSAKDLFRVVPTVTTSGEGSMPSGPVSSLATSDALDAKLAEPPSMSAGPKNSSATSDALDAKLAEPPSMPSGPKNSLATSDPLAAKLAEPPPLPSGPKNSLATSDALDAKLGEPPSMPSGPKNSLATADTLDAKLAEPPSMPSGPNSSLGMSDALDAKPAQPPPVPSGPKNSMATSAALDAKLAEPPSMPSGPKNSLSTSVALDAKLAEPPSPQSRASRTAATAELESYLNRTASKPTPQRNGSRLEESRAVRTISKEERDRTGARDRSHRERSRSYGTWGRRPGGGGRDKPQLKRSRSYDGRGRRQVAARSSRENASRRGDERCEVGSVGQVARVHVTGLDNDITEKRLNGIFAEYGEVLGLHLMPARSHAARPAAIIRYSTPQAAEMAIIALKDKYEVQLAKPNPKWDKCDSTRSVY